MKSAVMGAMFGLGAFTAIAEPAASNHPVTAVTKPPLTDEQLDQSVAQTVLLARVGLYAEAEQRCKQVLERNPNQPTVKQLLSEIEIQRRRQSSYELKRILEQTIMPEVDFHAAVASEVIEFLRAETKTLSPTKIEINFVWQVPPGVATPPVTLHLRNLPLCDVLEYVTKQAKLRYRVDEHAVVIYRPAPEKAVPPATEPDVKPQ
jgi:hypothetical protein